MPHLVDRAGRFVPWCLFVQETQGDRILMAQGNQDHQGDQDVQTLANQHSPSHQGTHYVLQRGNREMEQNALGEQMKIWMEGSDEETVSVCCTVF